MNASSRGGAVAAVAIVLALVGWAFWKGPETAPGEGVEAAVAPADAAATDAGGETAGAAEEPAAGETVGAGDPSATDAAAAVSPDATPPTIDVLRVAPDGTATLAGRAGAGDEISILVDGANAATVTADSAGQFATVFTLAPSAAARLLSLSARSADGTVVEGAEEVAIAPMPEAVAEAPEVIAEAPQAAAPEPAAEPEAEPEAPAAIKITDAGAEVLQSSGEGADTAPAPAAVTLDVISYTADGAVQLGGRGTAGATLRLYLDNAEIASTAVAADGAWSLITGDIAPGIYTLRIDQLDASGAVTSRIETPFKRETLEALAAASAEAAPEAAPEAVPAEGGAEPPASPEALASAQPEAPATEPVAGAAPQGAEGAVTATSTEAAAPLVEAAPEAAPAVVAADPAPAASPPPITVTVQPGFTLWAIARENLGAGILYVQVFEANQDQIRDPDLIYPGQVLSVPASP